MRTTQTNFFGPTESPLRSRFVAGSIAALLVALVPGVAGAQPSTRGAPVLRTPGLAPGGAARPQIGTPPAAGGVAGKTPPGAGGTPAPGGVGAAKDATTPTASLGGEDP